MENKQRKNLTPLWTSKCNFGLIETKESLHSFSKMVQVQFEDARFSNFAVVVKELDRIPANTLGTVVK